MNTSVGTLKPDIVTTHLEANASIEAANTYFSAAAAMVVMDPYDAKSLMRFNATAILNRLSIKAYALIHTSASLNFVSTEFVMANGLYQICKAAPKLAIRVGCEQRSSTTRVFCPSDFTIDGHEFTDLQFFVLPHFKSLDFILGLLV